MKLHIVTYQVGGYAREDAPVTRVAGAFVNPKLAEKIRIIVGGDIEEIELDHVAPGYLQTAEALGITLPPLDIDPFNCPNCGAHDFGLTTPTCSHCGYKA